MLISDGRQAIKEEAPIERMRSLTSELQQIYHSLAATSAGPAQGDGQARGNGQADGRPQGGAPGGDSDDVIDAEFTTE